MLFINVVKEGHQQFKPLVKPSVKLSIKLTSSCTQAALILVAV
jgi:hypothetical protein